MKIMRQRAVTSISHFFVDPVFADSIVPACLSLFSLYLHQLQKKNAKSPIYGQKAIVYLRWLTEENIHSCCIFWCTSQTNTLFRFCIYSGEKKSLALISPLDTEKRSHPDHCLQLTDKSWLTASTNWVSLVFDYK